MPNRYGLASETPSSCATFINVFLVSRLEPNLSNDEQVISKRGSDGLILNAVKILLIAARHQMLRRSDVKEKSSIMYIRSATDKHNPIHLHPFNSLPPLQIIHPLL